MSLRVGIWPHADLPHLVPCFRICRELLKWGHEVAVLGSDVHKIGRGHSEAWGSQLAAFHLDGRQVVHRSRELNVSDWLAQKTRERGLDILILDAVWQGLAFACPASSERRVVIHHAGLPDFRSSDMPPWYFVHPAHTREQWALARASNERFEQAGYGVRGMFTSIKALSMPGTKAELGTKASDVFGFGCGEFETVPAIRAMSLGPAAEFPDERGRVRYFGTLLPNPQDIDWRPPPAEMMDASQSLIACVFGTTGLHSREEYEWLFSLGKNLAKSFSGCQILVVIPEQVRRELTHGDCPRNLLLHPWIPLWELLSSRESHKVLVTTPGIGAFREAVASATPIVAIPRRLDQFGAAARVEYFGVGSALVSHELPHPELVATQVAHALQDPGIRMRTHQLQHELVAFDATQPLRRFIDEDGLAQT